MRQLILKLYHKVSGWKVIELLAKIYRNGFFLTNWRACQRLKKTRVFIKKQTDQKIRVVFLCQNTEIWGKVQPVYEKMVLDPRFCVFLIAVPEITKKTDFNETYRYLMSLGYKNVIDANRQGQWYNLKSLKPQYVFYPRPYDQYLPKEYRSKVVSGYTQICYIAYAFCLSPKTVSICLEKLFFRNVYLYFAENSFFEKYNKKRMAYSHRRGIRKTLNVGYPLLEKMADLETSYLNKEFCVLWTPRWSNDKEVGGSNFLSYKEKFVDFVEQDDSFSLIFRPHPLTFYHFIATGNVTQEEVVRYKEKYQQERFLLDEGADYIQTFSKADVLVTDISSMMVEYFLTKKPIIYCETGAPKSEFTKEILKGCYITNSFEEVQEVLKELSNGNDPLKEAREQKVKEMFGKDISGASERILEQLVQDFQEGSF